MMKRIFSILLALCSLFSVAILPLTAADGVEVVTESIESTTAYEDLSKATIKGLPINMDFRYPLKKAASQDAFELITLVEVGYKQGVGANSQTDFALYAYVYYPRGTRLITASTKHTITLATAFEKTNAAGELQTNPADWSATEHHPFTMTLVNLDETAATGVGKYPIYKFKVNATAADLQAGFTASGDQRRYDISEVELHFRNSSTAESFTVGHSFTCSGYRANKTFSMTAKDFAVLELEPEHTYFRYANQEDLHLQTQVNSVYFAVPKTYRKNYDSLDAITAKWFEAHSTPMVITIDDPLYKELYDWRGRDLMLTNEHPERALGVTQGGYDMLGLRKALWIYNNNYPAAFTPIASDAFLNGSCSQIAWLIPQYKDYLNDDRTFADTLVNSSVPTAQMLEYFDDYLQALGWDNIPEAGNETLFYTGLVELFVDEGRQYGWQTHTMHAKEMVEDLDGYKYSSGFSEWLDWLFGGPSHEMTALVREKIQRVEYSLLSSLTADMVSKKYLVAAPDVPKFMDFCKEAEEKDCDVIVFHFSSTKYYSAPLTIAHKSLVNTPAYVDGMAYVAKETLFLDFNLISLTYMKDGVAVNIPVAASPTNGIAGPEASVDQKDPGIGGSTISFPGLDDFLFDLKSTFAIIMGVLVIVIIIILVLSLIGPAAQVTGAVGRGIGSAAKGVSNAVKKNKRKRKK